MIPVFINSSLLSRTRYHLHHNRSAHHQYQNTTSHNARLNVSKAFNHIRTQFHTSSIQYNHKNSNKSNTNHISTGNSSNKPSITDIASNQIDQLPASSIPSTNDIPLPPSNQWTELFNHSIQYYPLHTIGSLMLIEFTSFAVINYILSSTTHQFTNLWIAAYFISWPIRRSIVVKLLCTPILAVPMSYIVPGLRYVDLTKLLQTPFIHRIKNIFVRSNNTGTTANTTQSRLHKITKQYGLSAFISYRILGAIVMLLMYVLLEYGFNVSAMLQNIGINIDNSYIHQYNKSSVYVVSLICCAFVFPFNIAIVPYVVQKLIRPITRSISRLFSGRSKLQ